MATFRIDTPDGKSFEIQGDREPTEQEIAQMIGSQSQGQNTLDKIAGVASTISHGATLGFGDKIGGAINGVGRVLASPITGNL